MTANELAAQFLTRKAPTARGVKLSKRQYDWLRDASNREGGATGSKVVLDGLTDATNCFARYGDGWLLIALGGHAWSLWTGTELPTATEALRLDRA